MTIPPRIIMRLIGFFMNLLSWIAPRRAAKIAFNLFIKPPKPRLRAKEQALLDQAERRNLRDSVYYIWGEADKPYILLSYGWGYNAGRWRHFIPAMLEDGYRVIAYDPPGHGHAPNGKLTLPANAEIMQHLIREFGKPAAMVGHSFGGASAVLALSKLPPSLHPSRLVVMASFADANGVFRDYQHRLGMREGLYQDYVRLVEKATGDSLEAYDLARLAGSLGHVRGLIVHDPSETVTEFKHAVRYQKYWPGSMLLEAHHAGHHLGKAPITEAVCAFAVDGILPEGAYPAEKPMSADHDLSRFFAGMEG